MSFDHGATWERRDAGITDSLIVSVAVAYPSAWKPVLFVQTDTGGVFSSADLGKTWTAMKSNSLPRNIDFIISAAPGEVGAILCAARYPTGLSISTDDGVSWRDATANLPQTHLYDLVSSGTGLWAATDSGIWLSVDTGRSWISRSVGVPDLEVRALAVANPRSNHPVLFAGCFFNGFCYSTDYGQTWQVDNSGLVQPHFFGLFVAENKSASYLLASTGEGVFRRPIAQLGVVTRLRGADLNDISASPNPTNGETMLSGLLNKATRIEVTNLLGEIILERRSQHSGEVTLDLSNEPMGTYFIRIISPTSVVVRKVLKE